MEFSYTYRDATGAMKSGTVTAPSRGVAIASLKAKGVTPVRISAQAGGRADGAVNAGMRGRQHHILWVGGVLMVALATGILWRILSHGGAKTETVRPRQNMPVARPNTVRPAHIEEAKPRNPVQPRAEVPASASRRRSVAADGGQPRGGLAKVLSTTTNDAGFIVTTIVDANGETNLLTETVIPQTFTDPMLQIIAAAVGGAYESELAPLPPIGPEGDAQLRAALKVDVPDLESDTEDIRRLKEAVRNTREEMLRLLDGGTSVNEILTQHQELWNENVRIRREMKAEYMQTLKNGDAEAAAEYLRKVNGVFRSMGITEISEDEVKVKPRRGKEGVME